MLVNTAQSHFKFDRFDQSPVGSFDSLAPLRPGHTMRKSPKSYHRRTVSCLAVASHHEHYEQSSYLAPTGRFYEIELSEATSASPVNHTRHVQRKSEGAISLVQLQQSLSGAGVAVISSDAKGKENAPTANGGSSLLGGKLIKPLLHLSLPQTHYFKTPTYGDCEQAASSWLTSREYDETLDPEWKSNPSPCACYCSRVPPTRLRFEKMNVISPAPAPRRSLLSDLLNSQAPTRLEQNANRRRMLKSMRRYSVDASEMDFNLCRPSGRASTLQTISSEGEASSESSSSSSSSMSSGAMLINGRSFSSTPTVRYLRNPCHATVKTKLQPSAYRRGNEVDGDAPDYFGTEDRVW
ncbi:hypothetical protein BGZ59_009821 [Podila verticillata]|nr:hypothetical protein BGZ59_009821 [Podila verticillata]KFH74004.1 hypothetical protein MVEG_01217 [Podila verticillata NRRL 6337]